MSLVLGRSRSSWLSQGGVWKAVRPCRHIGYVIAWVKKSMHVECDLVNIQTECLLTWMAELLGIGMAHVCLDRGALS